MEAVEKLAEDQGGGERPKHSLDRVIDQPMLAVIFIERMHCLSLSASGTKVRILAGC